MSVPQPHEALEGHCAAIHDNTLYVLSPSGLQSLPLKKNATWSRQPQGHAVTGPACVYVDAQDAWYVIGGATRDGSFSGLQRYFFANQTWESLSPPTDNLQGRTNHSAAYLSDAQSILVYAGSQPDAPSDLSSQTFLVSTEPPYNIEAFTSRAPPANQPILEPWNATHAVMVGGSPDNTDVFTFGQSEGWQQLRTNLKNPIDAAARGTVIDGSDGSKVLQVFNVDKSPNTVSGLVLLGAHGRSPSNGQTVGGGGGGSSSSSSNQRKRDLTLDNWPSYNSTNAPTATRTDCAVAQGPSGLVAIAGGNPDAPVALFDSSDNSWVDAADFFDSKDQQPLQPSSTVGSAPTASATSSASSSASSTAAAGAGGGMTSHQRMLRTLGITLGVLCGIAAVFIIALLYLRWRKLKQKKHEGSVDEKPGNRMSFADRGASFMKEAGGSINVLAPPGKDRYNAANDGSRSSLAIIAGKFGNKRNTIERPSRSSFESTSHLVKEKNAAAVATEPVEMVDIGPQGMPVSRKPVARTEPTPPEAAVRNSTRSLLGTRPNDKRKRSSGWSKYFATSGPSGPDGLSHLSAAYLKPDGRASFSEFSDYSNRSTRDPSRIPTSALVPPLDIDFGNTFNGQRLSQVTCGSPIFSDSREDLAKRGSTSQAAEGQRGLIVNERPDSRDRQSQISGYSLSSNNRTTLSSALTSDYFTDFGQTPWTSVSLRDHATNSDRGSSIYTASIHDSRDRMPSRGKSAGFFPGNGVSYRPATRPKGNGSPAKSGSNLAVSKPAEDRDSTMTVFPRGVPSAYYADREKARETEQTQAPASTSTKLPQSDRKAVMSDMSWIDLGLDKDS